LYVKQKIERSFENFTLQPNPRPPEFKLAFLEKALFHSGYHTYVLFDLMIEASAGDGKQPVACLKCISDRQEDRKIGSD